MLTRLNTTTPYLLVLALEPNTGGEDLRILLAGPSIREFAGHLQIGTADVAAALPAIVRILLRELETENSGNICFRASFAKSSSPLLVQGEAGQLESAFTPVHPLVIIITIKAVEREYLAVSAFSTSARSSVAIAT